MYARFASVRPIIGPAVVPIVAAGRAGLPADTLKDDTNTIPLFEDDGTTPLQKGSEP